jgi:hypothetical protein
MRLYDGQVGVASSSTSAGVEYSDNSTRPNQPFHPPCGSTWCRDGNNAAGADVDPSPSPTLLTERVASANIAPDRPPRTWLECGSVAVVPRR